MCSTIGMSADSQKLVDLGGVRKCSTIDDTTTMALDKKDWGTFLWSCIAHGVEQGIIISIFAPEV